MGAGTGARSSLEEDLGGFVRLMQEAPPLRTASRNLPAVPHSGIGGEGPVAGQGFHDVVERKELTLQAAMQQLALYRQHLPPSQGSAAKTLTPEQEGGSQVLA